MQKGQIFSLDFLISLVAVTAAVGLMIQAMELNTYYQKEEREFNELKAVAETAGNLLVSNPEIICDLVDASETSIIGYLNNCLSKVDFTKVPPGQWPPGDQGWWKTHGITGARYLGKERLGIPDEYGCFIEITGGDMGPQDRLVIFDCINDSGDVENYYYASREVVVYTKGDEIEDDSTVPKSEFEECLQGLVSCKLKQGTVTIKVWKI